MESPVRAIVDVVVGMCFVLVCWFWWGFARDVANRVSEGRYFGFVAEMLVCDISVRCVEV